MISKEGREYRKVIIGIANIGKWRGFGKKRVGVHVTMHAPDKRRRDVDNIFKALGDSLTHAGVWDDDSQIDDLRITRGEVVRGGLLNVMIKVIDQCAI